MPQAIKVQFDVLFDCNTFSTYVLFDMVLNP
jgi:hypothetical protein